MSRLYVGVVEKVVDKAIVELNKRNQYHCARNGNWSCIVDALGMTLCHYGAVIAVCARDGKFYCTATSASDRDGVNTFSRIVLDRPAVRFKNFDPVPYFGQENDPDIVVLGSIQAVRDASFKAYREATDGGRVIGARGI